MGGDEIEHGDWPWIVAIYLNKPSGMTFNCGGSLVSQKAVVTAAHCVFRQTKQYLASELTVYLGRHKLTDHFNEHMKAVSVNEIHVHDDYMEKSNSYDADLSILVLQQTIEFTKYIRPVCLWPARTDVNEVTNKRGTVVGWGRDEFNPVSDIPKKIDLPIVSPFTCVQRSPALTHIISERTFCAGTLDNRGPCKGDSGNLAQWRHFL